MGEQPDERSLPTHMTTQTHNNTQTSMLHVGFEPTTPIILYFSILLHKESEKTKHAHMKMEINEIATKTNTSLKLHNIACNKGNKSSEADSFKTKKENILHT
jgi:hypothetical protein